MSLTTTSSTASAALLPDCDECTVGMVPAGRHEHTYWTCRYCGNTVPAAA